MVRKSDSEIIQLKLNEKKILKHQERIERVCAKRALIREEKTTEIEPHSRNPEMDLTVL